MASGLFFTLFSLPLGGFGGLGSGLSGGASGLPNTSNPIGGAASGVQQPSMPQLPSTNTLNSSMPGDPTAGRLGSGAELPTTTNEKPNISTSNNSVAKMLTNNKNNGFTFIKYHSKSKSYDILLQFVFQYEDAKRSGRKYYHSFAVTKVGYTKEGLKDKILGNDRYVNSEFVKISDFVSTEDGKGQITLDLTAPYPSQTHVESFLEYKQELKRHISYASDLTLTNLLYDDNGDTSYHNINVCDNYKLVQELLSRLNGRKCYEDKSLLQREVYIYRLKFDRSKQDTPVDRLHRDVQKYRLESIEMELSDWKSSGFIAKTWTDGWRSRLNLLVGPRKVKLILNLDKYVPSAQLTTYAKDTRSLLFLWKDDITANVPTIEKPKIDPKFDIAKSINQSKNPNIPALTERERNILGGNLGQDNEDW